MWRQTMRWSHATGIALALVLAIAPWIATAGDVLRPHDSASNVASDRDQDDSPPAYETRSLRGRVGWTAEILRRRFDINTDNDAEQASVALDGADGRVYPIVKDDRGRGFFLDERLRDVDMELFVRQYDGSPMIQVIRVYTLKDGRKYELDYWCDICAIPMYELKDCECCQGPTRIRERPVQDARQGAKSPAE